MKKEEIIVVLKEEVEVGKEEVEEGNGRVSWLSREVKEVIEGIK